MHSYSIGKNIKPPPPNNIPSFMVAQYKQHCLGLASVCTPTYKVNTPHPQKKLRKKERKKKGEKGTPKDQKPNSERATMEN